MPQRQSAVVQSVYTLEQWLDWQQKLHSAPMALGLDRCREVADRMGTLDPSFPVISVAGTNGKGSSVAIFEAIFCAAGYKVGTYTSPHLVHYNERIRVQQQPVTDEVLCDAFARVEDARGDVKLTVFEFGTLAALYILKESEVEVAVLEVGLGGRLDAVNIVDADLALITSIDCDHEQWLGRERNQIALEKGGIMRPDHYAVYADANAVESLPRMARQLGARLFVYGEDFSCSRHGDHWQWHGGKRRRANLPLPHPYSHCQLYNASGVLMALDLLADHIAVTDDAINKGLTASYLPCRFTVLPGAPEIIMDVAHNPQAIAELVDSVSIMSERAGKIHVMIGVLADKDINGILRNMIPLADSWHCVTTDGARGLSASNLVTKLEQAGASCPMYCYNDVDSALDSLLHDCAADDCILITGSFLVVGPAFDRVGSRGCQQPHR